MALPSIVRSATRHVALNGLSAVGRLSGDREKAFARPRVHFLYLHAVPPAEAEAFRLLLATLSSRHQFISYSDAVRRISGGPIDRPYVCFSFDDGFQSCLRAAAILDEFDATGCFFVPTAFIGCRTVAEARAFFPQCAAGWVRIERSRRWKPMGSS